MALFTSEILGYNVWCVFYQYIQGKVLLCRNYRVCFCGSHQY